MQLAVIDQATAARTAERAPNPITLTNDEVIDPSKETIREAKRVLWDRYGVRSLLTRTNPKLLKGRAYGWDATVLHLAPADLSGYEVCPSRSPGCTRACLHTAGSPIYQRGKDGARVGRTRFAFEHRDLFHALLVHEVELHVRAAGRAGLRPAVRLNGTSDLVWERRFPLLFARFAGVQFFDYTAVARRFDPGWRLPANYELIFSRKEDNDAACLNVLRAGGRVAAVFGGCGDSRFPRPLPETWAGFPVVDGDKHDLIFLQPRGAVVGLRAKGRARNEWVGFVVGCLPRTSPTDRGTAGGGRSHDARSASGCRPRPGY